MVIRAVAATVAFVPTAALAASPEAHGVPGRQDHRDCVATTEWRHVVASKSPWTRARFDTFTETVGVPFYIVPTDGGTNYSWYSNVGCQGKVAWVGYDETDHLRAIVWGAR